MSHDFKDRHGREWQIVIDGYVLHRAKRIGGLDLKELFAGFTLNEEKDGKGIPIDPTVLLELAFFGCEWQAKIKSGEVDIEDFLRAMTRQAFIDCVNACGEAVQIAMAPGDDGEAADNLPLGETPPEDAPTAEEAAGAKPTG